MENICDEHIKQNEQDKITSSEAGAGHFAVYSEHANILRTWLTAYGIGGPVLVLSQEKLWQKLSDAGSLKIIAIYFLIGVGLQVALAAINKSVMWSCYYGDLYPPFQKSYQYKCASWLSERYSIDLLIDFTSIALFGIATYKIFASLNL